jgi:hypothetical protein
MLTVRIGRIKGAPKSKGVLGASHQNFVDHTACSARQRACTVQWTPHTVNHTPMLAMQDVHNVPAAKLMRTPYTQPGGCEIDRESRGCAQHIETPSRCTQVESLGSGTGK